MLGPFLFKPLDPATDEVDEVALGESGSGVRVVTPVVDGVDLDMGGEPEVTVLESLVRKPNRRDLMVHAPPSRVPSSPLESALMTEPIKPLPPRISA